MRRFSMILFLALSCVLLALTGFAQDAGDFKPATTNVWGAEYPKVDSQGRVMLRIKAPDATKVRINFWSNPKADMEKQADGFWTYTTPPMVPGLHYYNFVVDGAPEFHQVIAGAKDGHKAVGFQHRLKLTRALVAVFTAIQYMNGQRGRPFGTAAQWIALDQDLVEPLPPGVSYAEGACLGIPAMTACHCVLGDGPVAGQTVLVQGGAGAVGRFAVQIAHAAGARVLATVRGAAQRDHVTQAVPQAGIVDRVADDLPARIGELTSGQGVDRIVEVDFGGNLALDLAVLRPGGVVAAYASRGDPQPAFPFYGFMRKGATLRTVMASALPAPARHAARQWLSGWLRSGHARIAVARTFALDEIAAAHEAVESGPRLGTVVVTCT